MRDPVLIETCTEHRTPDFFYANETKRDLDDRHPVINNSTE